jgi:hypothetical protein
VAAVRRIALLFIFVLVCISCVPPFDADLSLAVINLSRLTYQSTVGTGIRIWPDSPNYNGVFLPVKASFGTLSTVDPSRGFIFFTNSNGASLMYIRPDGNGGYTRVPDPATSGPMGIGGLYGRDPNYPAYEMRTLWYGDYAAVFSYDSSQPANSSALIFWQDYPGHIAPVSPVTFSGLLAAIMYSPVVLGAQFVPSMNIGGDSLNLLARDSGGYIHEVGVTTVNYSGYSGVTDVNGGYPLSFSLMFAGVNRCQYYHDAATGVSYASFYAAGAWQCWRWEAFGANVRQIAGITCRIDALLETGELLSTQDNVGRLFDAQGNLLTTFPFGSLRYSMEAYVNGTATVFLSRQVVSGGSLSLQLYSIPSSQLKTLTY